MSENKKNKVGYKKWRKTDWIFFLWFLLAILQIHYYIISVFGATNNFFLWNGLLMLLEGVVASWAIYTS